MVPLVFVFSKALEPATRKMSTTTRVTRVNCTVQNFTIGSYKSQSLKICFISTKASAKRLVDIHRPNGAFGPLKYWLNPGTLLLQILSLIQWVKLPCPTPIAILCMSSKEAGYREDSREHAGEAGHIQLTRIRTKEPTSSSRGVSPS